MTENEVRKYIVRLSTEERQTLEAMIHKGTHPASLTLKARILLKADISEAGEGWSDSHIVKALLLAASFRPCPVGGIRLTGRCRAIGISIR